MTSRITYPGDGTLYVIPFPYLDLTHVKVKVDNVELATDAYSFPTSGTVQLDTDPGASDVMVYRETPEEPLTVYQSGSVLSRGDLETDSLQALYRIEEMRDSIPGFPIASPLSPLVWDADGIDLENGDTELTGDLLLRGNLADTDGADLVGFQQDGPGALPGTVRDELLRVIRPEQFGADPTGVELSDDAFAACAALGRKITLRAGAIYYLSTRVSGIDGTHFVSDDPAGFYTIKFKTGAGGFNSMATEGDKADSTVCGFLWNQADGPGMEGAYFTTDGVAERVIYPIRVLGGCDSKPAVFKRIRFYGFSGMSGGLLSLNSIGDGGYDVDDIEGRNCQTALTTWTGGLQITVFEIDNDLVGGVHSYPGEFYNIRGYNLGMTGDALALYGQQSDVVNIAGVSHGLDRKGPVGYGVYGENVGEVVDLFCSHSIIKGIRGKDVYYDVVKLIHGAQYNDVEIEAVESCGRSVVVLGSSTATNGATTAMTQHNTVRIGTVKGIGTYGVGLTDTTAVVYIGGAQAPATAWPQNNRIEIDNVVGDAALDHIVYDGNTADASANNEVVLHKLSGTFAVSSIGGDGAGGAAFEGNCRLRYDRKSAVYASVGAVQNLVSTTITPVQFNTETRDDLGEYDNTTYTFTPKYPGTYDVNVWVRPGGLAIADDVDLRINKGGAGNGFKVRRALREHYGSAAEASFTVSGSVQIKAEDIGQASSALSVEIAVTGPGTLTITNIADMSFLEIHGRD